MFERFTDRARRVVVLAQEEARLLKHNYIGTEHILLGLLHEGEGVAAAALGRLNIELDTVREQVRQIIGEGTGHLSGHIPFTPRAKKVLELSLREALQLGHNYIGTEHILLGLIREGEGVAAQVLIRLGADLNRVRQQVIQLLHAYGEPEDVSRPERTTVVPQPERTVRVDSGGLARFRVRMRMFERRLTAIEQRIGAGPDETSSDAEIARLRVDRQAAADAQDYERAAALRDTERELLAGQKTRKESWAAQNPTLPELTETVRRLGQEVKRLSVVLGDHPGTGDNAGAGDGDDARDGGDARDGDGTGEGAA